MKKQKPKNMIFMKLAPGAAVLEGRRFATENANLASEVKSWVQGLHI